MAPSPIDVSFESVGRHFVVSESTHKISTRSDEPFICGFCLQPKDGSGWYHALAVHSDSRFPADDYIDANYVFCDPCVREAANDFPDLPLDRAIASRIQRDEPTPTRFHARTMAHIAQQRKQRILAVQNARKRIDAAFDAMRRLDDEPDTVAYDAVRKTYEAAVDAMNGLGKFVSGSSSAY